MVPVIMHRLGAAVLRYEGCVHSNLNSACCNVSSCDTAESTFIAACPEAVCPYILSWQEAAIAAHAAARRDVGIVPAVVIGDVFVVGEGCVILIRNACCTGLQRHKGQGCRA